LPLITSSSSATPNRDKDRDRDRDRDRDACEHKETVNGLKKIKIKSPPSPPPSHTVIVTSDSTSGSSSICTESVDLGRDVEIEVEKAVKGEEGDVVSVSCLSDECKGDSLKSEEPITVVNTHPLPPPPPPDCLPETQTDTHLSKELKAVELFPNTEKGKEKDKEKEKESIPSEQGRNTITVYAT
jgi:hypothetical protein